MLSFTEESAKQVQLLVMAPYVRVQYSALGGKERASLLVTVSVNGKDTWNHGILENSRYVKLHIGYEGVIEQISKSHMIPVKFRKCRAQSLTDVVQRIQRYVDTMI